MSKPRYSDAYLEAAIEDLIELQGFYERQSPNLAETFSKAVTTRLDLVLEFPEASATFDLSGARRVSVGGFPYYIIYRLVEDVVYVVSVVHQQRNPRHWLSRMKTFQ